MFYLGIFLVLYGVSISDHSAKTGKSLANGQDSRFCKDFKRNGDPDFFLYFW